MNNQDKNALRAAAFVAVVMACIIAVTLWSLL